MKSVIALFLGLLALAGPARTAWAQEGVARAAQPGAPAPHEPHGAGESYIVLPDLHEVTFHIAGATVTGAQLMYIGLVVCAVGMLFGLVQYRQITRQPVHESMAAVAVTIWETCKTYLIQQGRFLALLWVLVGVAVGYYIGGLQHQPYGHVITVVAASALGALGSYGVAWFGIRINTRANARASFAALRGYPLQSFAIPLKAGMSVGLLLVSVELAFMIAILVFLPADLVGHSFIGFAVGESLGATVLRICGGIFTKIADIGSDLMKIIFRLPEDDPKNPGVIADCTGDNAGDSIGPTADGFETYGVTGVALVTFLALALPENSIAGGHLLAWIFVMRILMILTSLLSYFINQRVTSAKFAHAHTFDPELPLIRLVMLTSLLSIIVTFIVSFLMLPPGTYGQLWWILSMIISCGTAAGALIPELTKSFTSTHSRHVKEILVATRRGGASLNILSGFVTGNFSAFWEGLLILVLMAFAYFMSTLPAVQHLIVPAGQEGGFFLTFSASVFAFGLVAFGFLGMGPVTIAVDSFGPVTDNAQSVYELSQIEQQPDVAGQIERDFGFKPDFSNAKHFLEANDGAGNTFKATAKPVLIGTAVVGATTMVSGIILLLERITGGDVVGKLSLVQPVIGLGVLLGGATIYWFTGASVQAVVTGATRAVTYIRQHLDLNARRADMKDSKEVVRICTVYAQRGMINIFLAIFCLALGIAFINSFFFIGYLFAIAFFGLFQAIFMVNAGGAWDNCKKIVEVDLRDAGSDLHAATVVGDTVGDPFKDTAAVAMNPMIKFTTLFGLLSTEIAVTIPHQSARWIIGACFCAAALVFIYISFYRMRVPEEE